MFQVAHDVLSSLDCNIQYCAKVMQTIIDEYREYRNVSAIFNEIFSPRMFSIHEALAVFTHMLYC